MVLICVSLTTSENERLLAYRGDHTWVASSDRLLSLSIPRLSCPSVSLHGLTPFFKKLFYFIFRAK